MNLNDGLIQEGFTKILGSITNVKIIQILNQLCTESQKNNNLARDACYGCFFRANSQSSGYPSLLGMASCADRYLNTTDYYHCQIYLRNATNNINSKSSPAILYCTFLECVRQVNKDALIRECLKEAIRDRLAGYICSITEMQLSQIFVNTTACILAKTRCGAQNPITGGLQEDEITNKLHIPIMNAILVNSEYDINIVQMPFGNGQFLDDCAKYRKLEQAGWPGVKC
ncbi:uncharacterized protein LOC117169361 [Belonocnema kinseyi]|uniref:uncharacterized protein LOC117169361 n=1 Tax=Belonocnema kinseyi TaxID=2817044 RepID=UPI00143CCC28|nr:uncharacterized protein LOC117169361 [Belonocnema kinseyi]